MKPYQQVKDILDRVRDIHRGLCEALERGERAARGEAEDFLRIVRAEERAMQDVLESAASDDNPVMETWLQYVPDEELSRALRELEFAPGMTLDEIVVEKTEFDRVLRDLYDGLATGSSAPRVQELFAALRDQVDSRITGEAWEAQT